MLERSDEAYDYMGSQGMGFTKSKNEIYFSATVNVGLQSS